jgi:hypothetical protein
MNEEELQLLVARARDAEDAPSQPPPGLLADARTSARRRRRSVALGAGALVAVVIATGVIVPRLATNDDTRPGPSEKPSVASIDELAEHGGPCPVRLPLPDDDSGHGFGSSTPAKADPTFKTPDRAWVCQYGNEIVGTSDAGTVLEWTLNDSVRRLDDARLGPVDASLEGITRVRPDAQGCTEELGPRWLLVTETGGDLTGVLVDGYGCQDVRLTDDPFVTSAGDPQAGGTVPGVLTAPGLAATLEDWWETSPPDVDNTPPPDELVITCTGDGPQVKNTTVAAQPGGVVLRVHSTMRKGSYLTYASDGLTGGDEIEQIESPATYGFAPGTLTLGCSVRPGMEETGTVDVEVTDPHGYWRSETLGDHGCTTNAITDWIAVQGKAGTPRAAVDALVTVFAHAADRDPSSYTAEPAPTGYSGGAKQTWIVLRLGAPDYSVDVTEVDGEFTATPGINCR